MTPMECVKYTYFVTNLDIFAGGAVAGAMIVVLARWLQQFMDVKFMIKLLKMKIELDDKVLKLKKKD